jgi:RNA polymerase sigma-70 factor (ECF subfamily)
MMMVTQAVTKQEFSIPPICRSNDDNRRAAKHSLQDHQKTTDEALIKSLAEGDKRVLQVLFERHNVSIFRFVLRLVRDESRAEDLVSEVFFEAWRNAGKFEGRSQVRTWLLAIARNKAIELLRRRSEAQLDEEVAAIIEDPSDNPETMIEKKDRSAILRKCLTKLSPMHREVIDLVYYHQKSIGEVAQIIGAPESTVKTRTFYARNRIATLLEKSGIDRGCL